MQQLLDRPRDHRQDRYWTAAAVVTVIAAVAALYGRTLRAYFFEDDFQWLASSWTFALPSLADIRHHTHFYRPVIELYFAWGPRLAGRGAAPFHAFSVAVHAANGVAVYALTRTLLRNAALAAAAALIFVVMPGYVHAVAWVGAIAEPLVTLWIVTAVTSFIVWLRTSSRAARLLSVAAMAAALLTHESGVTTIALIAAAHAAARWREGATGQTNAASHATGPFTRRPAAASVIAGMTRVYWPYCAVLLPYVIIATVVSRQNYVVEDGFYRAGSHVVANLLDYVISLYVGKHNFATYIGVAIAVPALFWVGSREVKFSITWILITLAPFLFFTWGNTSRYLYTPSVGFALLMACGLGALDRALVQVAPRSVRGAVVGALALAVALRFAVFANRGVDDFVSATEAYRTYLARFRAQHATLAPDATVAAPAVTDSRLRPVYVEAMVRWECEAPGAHLVFDTSGDQ